MESFERKSTINKAVGDTEEAQQEVMSTFEKRFNEQEFFPNELEKSTEALKAIEGILARMPDFLKEFGSSNLPIKPEHIHLIHGNEKGLKGHPDLDDDAGGGYDQKRQYIIIRVEDADSFLISMEKIVHEIIHAYSFNSIDHYDPITEDSPRITKARRVGIELQDKEMRDIGYLGIINEAVTLELQKLFAKRYFKEIPELKEEAEQREEAIEFLCNDAPERAEEFKDLMNAVGEDKEGKTYWTLNNYQYQEERKFLKTLIEDILTQTDEFKTYDEVFKLFAGGAMSGQILSLARLINNIYKERPIPGVETEETMYTDEKRKPFTILAQATMIDYSLHEDK